jgi:8-oxo-dGTP pyrophosphatase MutT (NUDIX family)
MHLTQPIDPEELADLGRRFGAMSYQHEVLAVTDPFLTENHQRLLSDGRRAEICYIMHRGAPADGILLHHKIFYPGPAFRLPTGGVDPGEAVWDTLVREIYEETGLTVKMGEDGPGEVVVEDFLGVVSYDFHHRRLNQHSAFATYHFLVQAPAGADPHPLDETEKVDGWRWLPAEALRAQAITLGSLDTTAPDWADWGRFRSLSHHFVADRLGTGLKK